MTGYGEEVREATARTGKRVVTPAAESFRKDFVATGLTDRMQAAGLTHGGLYNLDTNDQFVRRQPPNRRVPSWSGFRPPGQSGQVVPRSCPLSTWHPDKPGEDAHTRRSAANWAVRPRRLAGLRLADF